ncbi:organic solute transporter subunit alpha-like [Saccoglossus kowalevskii]|uniref:Organic solute transporter subunit alpha-like n=1 Tax=Saccoglossus kowalevskii TaxID=10224 RepID=A0ABM0M245_SACKO|nr:PREDICTED: organic solute transporter subunit alpha-like [Saccoglossus kowalevskii]
MADNDTECWDSETPDTKQLISGSTTLEKSLLTVATVLTLLTALQFFESVYYLRNKIQTKLRRNKMIWVLGIYPIYSITCCIGLFVPRAAMITNFTAAIRAGRWLRRAVLQVSIIRPCVLFIAVVLWAGGKLSPGGVGLMEPFLWVTIVSIASTITAIQAIGILHTVSMEPLKEYQITPKFICIQLTLILGSVQLGLLTLLSNVGIIPCAYPFANQPRVYNIYNFLVICEFFLINIFSRFLFRTRRHGNTEQVMTPEEAIEAGKNHITFYKTPPNSPYLVKFSSKNEVVNDVCDDNTNDGTVNVAMEQPQKSENH